MNQAANSKQIAQYHKAAMMNRVIGCVGIVGGTLVLATWVKMGLLVPYFFQLWGYPVAGGGLIALSVVNFWVSAYFLRKSRS